VTIATTYTAVDPSHIPHMSPPKTAQIPTSSSAAPHRVGRAGNRTMKWQFSRSQATGAWCFALMRPSHRALAGAAAVLCYLGWETRGGG